MRGNFAAPNGDYYTQVCPATVIQYRPPADDGCSSGPHFQVIWTTISPAENALSLFRQCQTALSVQLGNQATHHQSFSKLLIVVHAMRIPSGAVRSVFHFPKHANTDNFASGGPGADHCAEVNFTYGCPLPVDSIHLDLSDIAMGRLQGGGSLAAGVIPTRYKRIPCPVPGNVYIWLLTAAAHTTLLSASSTPMALDL
jgi:hypothetical protein